MSMQRFLDLAKAAHADSEQRVLSALGPEHLAQWQEFWSAEATPAHPIGKGAEEVPAPEEPR